MGSTGEYGELMLDRFVTMGEPAVKICANKADSDRQQAT
jgi:hypothetical protein